MCIQWERTIITYVIAKYGRENLSPSSEEEQMKRKKKCMKDESKLYGPRSCKQSLNPTPRMGTIQSHKAIKDVHCEGASYKLKHLSKDLNLSKMGSKSSYNNEKLSIAT